MARSKAWLPLPRFILPPPPASPYFILSINVCNELRIKELNQNLKIKEALFWVEAYEFAKMPCTVSLGEIPSRATICFSWNQPLWRSFSYQILLWFETTAITWVCCSGWWLRTKRHVTFSSCNDAFIIF